jgi:hypothetical protein
VLKMLLGSGRPGMKVWVTVAGGKVLLDARVPGLAPLVLETGEAIDPASEMLGAAMIAQPPAETTWPLGSPTAIRPAPDHTSSDARGFAEGVPIPPAG